MSDLKIFRNKILERLNEREDTTNLHTNEVKTLEELRDKYFEYSTDLKSNTIQENKYRIDSFINLLGKNTIFNDLRASAIASARDTMLKTPVIGGGGKGRTRTRKPSSVNNCLAGLKTLLNWGHTEGYVKDIDFRRVKPLRTSDTKIEWWNDDEVISILNAANRISRDIELYVALGIYLGLRRCELDKLMWCDFDKSENRWVIRTLGKYSKMRSIPICKELQLILENHIGLETEYVIRPDKTEMKEGPRCYRIDMRKQFWKVINSAGVKLITTHGMRHTFASLCLFKGVNLFKVSRWMGHSSTRVTEKEYAHMLARDDDIDILSFRK